MRKRISIIRVTTTLVAISLIFLVAMSTQAQTAVEDIVEIQNEGLAGWYTATDLDGSGNLGIAFYDLTLGAVRLIECANADCTTRSESQLNSGSGDTGRSLALVYDDANSANIAYRDHAAGNLLIANCDPDCNSATIGVVAGLGQDIDPGPGVDIRGDAGWHVDMVFDGITDTFILAYRNDADANRDNWTLDYATCQFSMGWSCSTPVTIGTVGGSGGFPAIALSDLGVPAIMYRNGINDDVVLFVCDNATCTTGTTTPFGLATHRSGYFNAADSDGTNMVFASYTVRNDSTGTEDFIRIVTCSAVTIGGNFCTSTSNTVRSVQAEGFFTDVAIDPTNGHTVISYFDLLNNEAEILRCDALICFLPPGETPTEMPLPTQLDGLPGYWTSLELDSSGNALMTFTSHEAGDNVYLYNENLPAELPPFVVINPADGSVRGNTTQFLQMDYSETVDIGVGTVDIACPGGTNTTLPMSSTLTDTTQITIANAPVGATCTLTVNSASLTDDDTNDATYDNLLRDHEITYTVDDGANAMFTGVTVVGTGPNSKLELDFTKPVNLPIGGTTITCNSNPVVFTGLPATHQSTVTLIPVEPLPIGATCTANITDFRNMDMGTSVGNGSNDLNGLNNLLGLASAPRIDAVATTSPGPLDAPALMGSQNFTVPNTPQNCFAYNPNSGQLFDSADHSAINAAVSAATGGDTLLLAGTCTADPTETATTLITINKDLTLIGGYNGSLNVANPGVWLATPDPVTYPTVIDANSSNRGSIGRVMQVNSGNTVTIQNVTLQGGNGLPVNVGGGIFNEGNLTLDTVSVQDNSAPLAGGGIYNISALILRDSSITGNSVPTGSGGGLANSSSGSLTVVRSLVRGNSASSGGGIWSLGTLLVSNSLLSGNTATTNGGALDMGSSSPINIVNTTIAGNVATDDGGGINTDATVNLQNSIVYNNQADQDGDDISVFGGSFTASYSLFGDVFGTVTSGADSIVNPGVPASSIFAAPEAPGLSTTGDYTLVIGSVAIDAGNDNLSNEATNNLDLNGNGTVDTVLGFVSADLAGNTREFDDPSTADTGLEAGISSIDANAIVDMGAYEAAFDLLVVDTLEEANDGDFSLGDLSLREALALNTDGALITFDASLDGGLIEIDTQQLVVNQDVIIDASSLSNGLTIDELGGAGSGGTRIMRIESGVTATLVGMTFINGNPDNAGGILNDGTATLINMQISGNNAAMGGFFSIGGGIRNNGTMTIINSQITRNQAVFDVEIFGGGIYNDGTLAIYNSTIASNRAFTNGPQTVLGGGIFNTAAGTLTIDNSLVVGNISQTLSGNNGGQNIHNDGGSVTIRNSMYGQSVGTITDGGGNITNPPSLNDLFITPQAAGGADAGSDYRLNVSALSALSDQTRNPINKGSNALLPSEVLLRFDLNNNGVLDAAIPLDRDYNARVQAGTVDMGAFETAPVLIVDTPIDVSNPSDGLTTLREAIAAANDGDTIAFAQNMDGQTITLSNAQLEVRKDLIIDATGLSNGLTVDGTNNTSQPIMLLDGFGGTKNITLRGFTLANGNVRGIDAGDVRLIMDQMRFINNTGPAGGHLALGGQEALILNSEFRGGVAAGPGFGGGISSRNTRTTIVNSLISGNDGNQGGGIYASPGNQLTIINSTIAGNEGATASGILADAGATVNLYNSIVAGNTQTGFPSTPDLGGGATFNVRNSLYEQPGTGVNNISGNIVAPSYPGGLSDLFVNPMPASNGSPQNGGDYTLNGAQLNLLGDQSINPISKGDNGWLDEATLTLDLNGDGDQADDLTTDTDLAGDPRLADTSTNVDMGAYELPVADGGSSFVVIGFDAYPDHVLGGETTLTIVVQATDTVGTPDGASSDAASSVPTISIFYSADATCAADDTVIAEIPVTEPGVLTLAVDLPRDLLAAQANNADLASLPAGTPSQDVGYLCAAVANDLDAGAAIDATNGKLVVADDITYFPYDGNGDGMVTPTDAMAVIQALGRANAQYDSDGNGVVSPSEALNVLLRLGYERNNAVMEPENTLNLGNRTAPTLDAMHSVP